MNDILGKVLKSGVKTSEFWVTLAALLLPYALQIPENSATAWAIAHGGAWAGYGVAGVYIAARAYIKGKQVTAIGPDALAVTQASELLAQYPDVLPALPQDLRTALAAAQAIAAQGIQDPAVLAAAIQRVATAARTAQAAAPQPSVFRD